MESITKQVRCIIAAYSKCLCCCIFSWVNRRFIASDLHLLSVASTHTHQLVNLYAQTIQFTEPTTKVHISWCSKSLIAIARLLSDQCEYMRSYHWAVCSTDEGHAIFFHFVHFLLLDERPIGMLFISNRFSKFIYGSILHSFILKNPVQYLHTFLI